MHPPHILHKCNAGHCETCVKSLRSINIKSVPTHVAKVAKFAQCTLDIKVDIWLGGKKLMGWIWKDEDKKNYCYCSDIQTFKHKGLTKTILI